MNINLLPPAIKEALRFVPQVEAGRDSVTLPGLQAVCLEVDWIDEHCPTKLGTIKIAYGRARESVVTGAASENYEFVVATLKRSQLRVKEIQLQDLSKLIFRATALEEEDGSFFAVSLGFSGQYGYGSYGNGDGRFMSAMVHAAIEAWAPFAVILDLRELSYEFGNTIIYAVTAGRDEDSQEWTTPTRIVTSERCRLGLTTLLQYLRLDPGTWLFDTTEDAYAAVKSLHEPL